MLAWRSCVNHVIFHLVTVLLNFTIQTEIMNLQYLECGNNRRMISRKLNSTLILRCPAGLLDRQCEKIHNFLVLGCSDLQLNSYMSQD